MASPDTGARAALVDELDSLVFSGSYDEVLRRTAGGCSDAEAPAMVGALALSGRLDEAESVFESRFGGGSSGAGAARARFFLIAGLCHGGHADKALRHARVGVLGVLRGPVEQRYWAAQGLALVRHFEGRAGRARRVARRALAAAVEADFPYGRFLSLDLLAHVAVQRGDVHAGMRLLGQASALADSLGYAENAATERAALLIFQLRFAVGSRDAALLSVRELVAGTGVSYFTRRNGLLEISSAHALAGRAGLALGALDEARRIALPGSDRRARVRWLCGHALCMALSQGPSAALASVLEARVEARGQLTLQAEIGFIEGIFCAPLTAEQLLGLERLAALTGAERVRVAWRVAAQPAEHAGLFAPRVEDGLCRLLLECGALPESERLRRVSQAELLGLVPWALRLLPGKRLIVSGTQVISENHGDVAVSELSNRPALKVLLELSRGYRSRAELLGAVWNINHFVPARHTPTLHTAISRLRLALREPDWVVTHDDGYSLLAGVEVLVLGDSALSSSPAADVLSRAAPPPDDRERVLAFIADQGAASSAEVARGLRLSGSTVLRQLRRLCAEGVLERQGAGRSTRYRRK